MVKAWPAAAVAVLFPGLQAHHLLNNGALVNKADGRGWNVLLL
jgi:hypothetical protein